MIISTTDYAFLSANVYKPQTERTKILRIAESSIAPRLRLEAFKAMLVCSPDNKDECIKMMRRDPAQSVRMEASLMECR